MAGFTVSAILKFTPLSGAHNEEPLCYLLEIDEYKLLLDCGWNELFNTDRLQLLAKFAPQVDAVLLTYPDLEHLGGLAYAVGKLGLDCPIYSTKPVKRMGQLFLYDAFQSRNMYEDFDLFSLDDIDAVAERMVDLDYEQIFSLKDKVTGMDTGIKIQASYAGHMIGGAIWKIFKDDAEEIIYAVDYNISKERPSLLITDSLQIKKKRVHKRKDIDRSFLRTIIQALRLGGNVMIPTDTAGRMLELLQVLVHHPEGWAKNKALSGYTLCLLSPIGQSVLNASIEMVNYASDEMRQALSKGNPFQMRGQAWPFQVETRSIMNLKNAHGKVVLFSGDGLESGLGRELFREWSQDRKNLLFFTSTPAPGTFGRLLVDNPRTPEATITVKEKVPLRGAELAAHRAKVARERAEEAAASAPVEEARISGGGGVDEGAAMVDSDDDDDGEALLMAHDLMEPRGGAASGSSYFRQADTNNMFPCIEDRTPVDDYGEKIRPEDYMMDEAADPNMPVGGGAAAAGGAADGGGGAADGGVDGSGIYEAHPTKCVQREETIKLMCSRKKIEGYEGRSDGESIMRILRQSVKPRSLIVIHGSKENTEEMEDMCCEDTDMMVEKVESPAEGVCVNITPKGNMYQVRLMDSLMTSLQFSRVQDHELAWLDAMINTEMDAGEDDGALQVEVAGQVPTLVALPEAEAQSRSERSAMYVGQPPLSVILEKLKAAGFKAEFNLGKVVCNDTIQITKNKEEYCVEGPLSEDYYNVREVLYKQFAIV